MAEKTNPPSIRETMEMLNEASLKDLASSVGNKVKAAAGDKNAQGTEEAKRLAKHLKKMFEKWLGQTGGEANEENLMKFLISKIGFTAANARKIFDKSGVQDPTKTESVMEDLNSGDLDKVLLSAAQFAFAHDLIDDPEEDKKKGIKRQDNGDGAFGSSRGSSRYRRGNDHDDILHGVRPKDREEQEAAAAAQNQKLMKHVYGAGLEDEHMVELDEIVKQTKGDYKKIKSLPESEDVLEMLARLGYAYLRSQQKN